MSAEEKNEALNILFTENNADQNKNQDYKHSFQEFDLPEKYYLLEMYNKQKELQQFLADKGKTETFPNIVTDVTQPNVQLAIYHLFCMQIEFQELKVELQKLTEQPQDDNLDTIDARYELKLDYNWVPADNSVDRFMLNTKTIINTYREFNELYR